MADKGQTHIQQLASTWPEQMAYYRFINNDKVSASSLISGLTQATAQRIEAEHYLVLQDTTQVNLEKYRSRIEADSGLGLIADNRSLGFYLHAALVLNAATEGCVGFSAIQPFIHPPGQPDKYARKYQTLPIQQKESYRWIETIQRSAQVLGAARLRTYIQDREGDIFELLASHTEQDHLIVRSRDNRKIVHQGQLGDLYPTLAQSLLRGTYRLDLRGDLRQQHPKRQALMQVRFTQVSIRPPQRLGKHTPPLQVYAVESRECDTTVPAGEEPIHWRLLTTHRIESFEDACQIIYWYSLRWHIETLFRLLKTKGFAIEHIELQQGHSIIKMTLLAMQAALRVMALLLVSKTYVAQQDQPVHQLFSEKEVECLARLGQQLNSQTPRQKNPYPECSMKWAFWIMARLGGWKGIASQKPPGVITLHEGVKRFHLIFSGFALTDVYNP